MKVQANSNHLFRNAKGGALLASVVSSMTRGHGLTQEIRARKRLQRQRGVDLIQVAIYVVIAAVVIAGVVAGVGAIRAGIRVNNETRDLPTIFAKMQKVYANRSSYQGATQTVMVNMGVFPDNWVIAGSTNLQNQWSGAVTVAVGAIAGGANNAIILTSNGVPDDECKSIVTTMESAIRIATVNNTVVKADGAVTDVGALGTACANGQNTIAYTISK